MFQINKKGLLIVLSGPSGCGKGTILNEFLSNNDDTFLSISATTRNPRAGEVDGVNYYFMSKKEFEENIKQEQMLEYANYCGHYYGTPTKYVYDRINSGQNIILEIEVQGALQIRNKCPEAILVFVMPPSISELKRRLVDRNTEDIETVRKRMTTAIEEIKLSDKYDYIVLNDTINHAVKTIKSIINSEKYRVCHNKNIINEVLKDA